MKYNLILLILILSCTKESSLESSSETDILFNTPHGIVVDDSSGIIYMSDRGNGRIYSFS